MMFIVIRSALILDIDYNSYEDDQEGYYHEKGDEKGSETDNEEYW